MHPQPVGEQVGRDAGQASAEVGVAGAVVDQQLPHDQQGPAVPDDVEGPGEPAVLVVGAHARRVPRLTRISRFALTFSIIDFTVVFPVDWSER